MNYVKIHQVILENIVSGNLCRKTLLKYLQSFENVHI